MCAEDRLISILRAALTGQDAHLSDEDISASLSSLYAASARQGLAGMVAHYLSSRNRLSYDADSRRFTDALIMSTMRTERMKYDLSVVETVLTDNAIPYIPLKGAVLRRHYPQESMRISSDIDILIHEADIDKAVSALCEKGYLYKERTYHDILMVTPQEHFLELHFNLLETKDNLDNILAHAWDYAVPEEHYRYAFTDAFFLFHFMAHMMYHFATGNGGIRFLCDLWVIENRMHIPVDTAKEMLEQAGIYTFAKEMQRLTCICFDSEPSDAKADTILSFMMSSNSASMPLAAMAMDNKGKASYTFGRLFPRYKTMKETYPILRKAPILLPIMWIYRMANKLKAGKAKRVATEWKTAANASDEIPNLQNMFRYLELTK